MINKYFQDFASGPRFQDLCQAGVKGLITAIDRFESKRRLQLSTYSLFWIRHSIVRSITLSSFTRVPFGLDRVFIFLINMVIIFETGLIDFNFTKAAYFVFLRTSKAFL